ncbi:MAG TPA: response regulator [Thermoanaerobaculia bacterium]|nr:response regulator [Thermoanaerobaculia bacterium]
MTSDAGAPVNILAVDDSPDKLLALSVVLAELHQNVVTATSGRDALRALLTDEFAVVLLDVNMPGMDGFETAALIRQRRTSEHTPIIFITSYGDETHASRGYKLGAVDYILAPVDPEVLQTKVMVFVELYRKTAQIKQQARSLEQKALQLQRLTEASLSINSALSPDEMLRVVTDMARDMLGAHQAVAVAAVDQKWVQPNTAVSLSSRYEAGGERTVLRDRTALLAFLSQVRRTVRIRRGAPETSTPWEGLLASDRPFRLGWLAAPLSGRDRRHLGLIHLLDKRDGDFTDEDEAILTQLAQMTSIAIENTLNAEAREANRIKDEFLTTLSHELRTPLSAILGWTRTLRTGAADAVKVEHGLEVIERNVRAQTKLIDDLLDVSRIITGKLRLTVRPAALAPIIDAALDAMRPAAEAKDIQIAVERRLSPGEDMVVGDPDRLQQVVWNLVSNAIKFTPPGGRVTVELSRADADFQIRVSDTGRGISPEFLPRVFERFHQGDSSTTRAHGGLGIGLAIARHLVELHGGTISAQSPGENAGSFFTVLLPRVALGIHTPEALPREEEPAVPGARASVGNIEGVSVLLVEDEPDGRELLVEALRTAGGRVAAAESARAALALFADRPPDVLVSDIGMPEEDGYALIRAIRALPADRGGAVPAIAVTAYAREEDRLRALAAGFQAHIAKPVDPGELVAAVARVAWAGNSREPHSAPMEVAARGSAAPNGNGDEQLVRILVVEDDADSRDGLKNLLEIWGHAVDVARTGREGIEQAIRHRPGVALIDIGLPELDGYQVAQRIREALGSEKIFLVAITGYADARARQQALESGFDAHVAKPIDFSKLSSLIAARVGA